MSFLWCVILWFCATVVCCCKACVEDYISLREQFLDNTHNLEMLQDAFYPINKAPPVFVFINYYHNDEKTTNTCLNGLKRLNYDTISRHFSFGVMSSTYTKQYLCYWVWTDSITYLLFPPSFVNTYSLLTESYFSLVSREAILYLELPEPCDNFTDFQDDVHILTARVS